MKNLKHLFLLIISAATVTSCQKQPVANFTFDKDIYYAGDTIHLKDASTDAKKWKWTVPDGQTFTSKDLDYVIDSGDVGGYESFTLEVSTKNGNKDSHNSDSVLVSQPILASDYFVVQGYDPFYPTVKYSKNEGNVFEITAPEKPFSPYIIYYKIYFPGSNHPDSDAVYTLQSDANSLASDHACIKIFPQNSDVVWCYTSVSGFLNVEIANDGKVHAFFLM